MAEGDTQVSEGDSSTNPTIVNSTTWDRETENTPVYAVVSAIAEATGDDPLDELPPLHETIDPDALNSLFTSRSSTTVSQVSFQYAGYVVVVKGSGEVHVHPVQDG